MTGSRSAPRLLLAAIVAYAALARLLYLSAYRSDPFFGALMHDADRYHRWASALAAGGAWEKGAFYQAPLYPWLLGLLYRVAGPRPAAAYLAQLGLGLVTILLVHRAARRAYGSAAALAAAALAAGYAAPVFQETKVLPAALTVFLAVLLAERLQAADASPAWPAWLAPGAVLGLGAVANPSFLLTGFLAAVWIIAGRGPGRPRLARLGAFAAGAALVVAPVTVRNLAVSGEFVLVSANGGVTFWQGNNPLAVGVYATPPGLTGDIDRQREASRRQAEAGTGRRLGDAGVSSYYRRLALSFIRAEPGRWLALEGRKILLALAGEEQPLEYGQRLDANPARRLFPVSFALILGLAAAGLAFRRREERGAGEAPLLIVAAGQFAVLLIFYVAGRYRLPASMALLPAAGSGAALLARRLRRGLRGAAAPALLAAAVAAASAAYFPLVQGRMLRGQTAMGLCDRGVVLVNAGRLGEAIEDFHRAAELDPGYPWAWLDLGRALMAAGRWGEAEPALRRGLGANPSMPEAWSALGQFLAATGRPAEAGEAFARAGRLKSAGEPPRP